MEDVLREVARDVGLKAEQVEVQLVVSDAPRDSRQGREMLLDVCW